MYDKIKILTFAKGNFVESQQKLKNHLVSIGLSHQKHMTDRDLPNSFLSENADILSLKKGYGYCIWKPFIILEELKLLKDDEILLYIDSTDLPEKNFFDEVLKNFEEREYFFVNRGYNHGQWTKRDTFVLMDCDSEKFYNHVQLEAGVIGLKRNDFNIGIVKEWLQYAKNKNILTECPNISNLPNINNFTEHRYDQSILTNLFIKNNLISHCFGPNVIKYNYNQPKIY